MEDEENLSADQEECVKLAKQGDNLFITGSAGVGKSFIVEKIVSELKKDGKKVVKLGTSGVAACNIKGQTMHSFFNLPIFEFIDEKTAKYCSNFYKALWSQADVIIIDEASMLRADQLDGIHYTLKKNGCQGLMDKQIILVGDMKQLPAIIQDDMRTMFEEEYGILLPTFKDAHIYSAAEFIEYELTTIHRQSDKEFIDALNIVRDGGKTKYFEQFYSYEANDGIVLAPHNKTVDQYNNAGLAKVVGEEYEFKCIKSDDKVKVQDFNLQEIINVKHGCKIMYLINRQKLVNGSIGIFHVDNGKFFIIADGKMVKLELETFEKFAYKIIKGELTLVSVGSVTQYPFKLAYALSIHKSQGLTFDEVTVDLRRKCFTDGMLYVALSRVRGPEGLKIIK